VGSNPLGSWEHFRVLYFLTRGGIGFMAHEIPFLKGSNA
jgi:hypothetical protein